jgi:(E)-4-hydroxy-3-methyl-but-2-enyl pyrophosphate reductase
MLKSKAKRQKPTAKGQTGRVQKLEARSEMAEVKIGSGQRMRSEGRSQKPRGKAPKVVVARPTGFCFGVERAIRLAKAGKKQHGRVSTLGELVHNPLVLSELEREGIRSVRSLRQVRAGALVIRAHGCPPQTLAECSRLGIALVDATCPYVRKVQNVARRLKEQGYTVVVVGERNHPEVKSILGHCEGRGLVYSPKMRLKSGKIGVVAQTTMSRERLREAVANLSRLRYTELRIFDTICEEVAARQQAAARIAQQVDLVVVVGGRNSANSSRLAEIARNAGRHVVFVERASEVPRRIVARAGRVGVVAGSSTPSRVVREIVAIVRNPAKEDRFNVS